MARGADNPSTKPDQTKPNQPNPATHQPTQPTNQPSNQPTPTYPPTHPTKQATKQPTNQPTNQPEAINSVSSSGRVRSTVLHWDFSVEPPSMGRAAMTQQTQTLGCGDKNTMLLRRVTPSTKLVHSSIASGLGRSQTGTSTKKVVQVQERMLQETSHPLLQQYGRTLAQWDGTDSDSTPNILEAMISQRKIPRRNAMRHAVAFQKTAHCCVVSCNPYERSL